MILIGYSSYASVTIRAAANPPMNSNNPNNPHALLSLLNRDQYGDRPLLYGAQYSAPPEGVKEKKVWYLDEDGKYKTATVLTGYTHAPEFMQLFPRMWNYSKGEKEYKQWAAYRTKTETLRDEKGEIRRDAQGRPMRGESARLRHARRSTPTPTANPHGHASRRSARTSTSSSTTSFRTCTGAISCGTSWDARATYSLRARRSPTATGSRASSGSTRNTSGRRTTCRAKSPTTRAATPIISCPSCWD